MLNKRIVEILVGLFIIAAGLSLFGLAFKVSGFSGYKKSDVIKVVAEFDNIGDLRVRSPVKISGVRVGEISDISLDKKTYRAKVTMMLEKNAKIPDDSSASIFSESLLGSNYIAIRPGFESEYLHNGSRIDETNSAIILENLIGQAIFKDKNDKDNKSGNK